MNYCIFLTREDEGGATEHTDIVADVHELYVELMCKVDADKVAGYIIRTEGYRIEETLEVCRLNPASLLLILLWY